MYGRYPNVGRVVRGVAGERDLGQDCSSGGYAGMSSFETWIVLRRVDSKITSKPEMMLLDNDCIA